MTILLFSQIYSAIVLHFTIEDPFIYKLMYTWMRNKGHGQSHKTPVSASAMLTGKFLQIRKAFVTSSLLAEELPDTLQYKISR